MGQGGPSLLHFVMEVLCPGILSTCTSSFNLFLAYRPTVLLKHCLNQVRLAGLTCHDRPLRNGSLFLDVGIVFHSLSSFLKVIAATVVSDPTKYSEAFLGKPNEEYRAWILDSEKWGGCLDILLFILTRH